MLEIILQHEVVHLMSQVKRTISRGSWIYHDDQIRQPQGGQGKVGATVAAVTRKRASAGLVSQLEANG